MNEKAEPQEITDKPSYRDLADGDMVPTFGIGRAIKEMYWNKRVSRLGWNGPGQYIAMQVPDRYSKMTLPYIYISTVQGDLVPWLASQTDLLATDWYVAEFTSGEGNNNCGVDPLYGDRANG